MEFQYKNAEKKNEANIFGEITASKEMMRVIGRDVNKSVCNLAGLVELLKDEDPAHEDFQNIQMHMNTEVTQLRRLIADMCSGF